MKFILQGILIVVLLRVSEFISEFLRLPIPGSLLGMIILFVLLETGVLKLGYISDFGNVVLKHLGFFFIPPAVSLMVSYGIVKGSILKMLVILSISLFIVMGITGKVVDRILKEDH